MPGERGIAGRELVPGGILFCIRFRFFLGEEGRREGEGPPSADHDARDGAGTSAESAWWRSAAKLQRRPETPGFAGPVDSVGFPKMEKAPDPHQQASPGPEAASRGALPRLGDLSGLEAHPQDEEVVCRYCLEASPRGELFHPCQCTTPVHTGCMRRWLTGGQRDASRRLQCELCKGKIAAKLALAPYSVLLRESEGRSILLVTALRMAYRLFLCRRLLTRYRPVLQRWRGVCSRSNPFDSTSVRGLFERAALYRDSLLGLLLGWLCCHLFARDVRSFLDSLRALRSKKAALTFLSGSECPSPREEEERGPGLLVRQDGSRDLTSWADRHRREEPGRRHVDLFWPFRSVLEPFVRRYGESGGPAAMRLSLGLTISHMQAEMALGMR